MTRTRAFIAVSAAVAAFAAAVPVASAATTSDSSGPAQRIVGGKASTVEYPWMARIRVPVEGKGFAICGATLVSPDVLLTAHHCLHDGPGNATPLPGKVEAFIGKLDWKQAEPAGLKRVEAVRQAGKGVKKGDWAVVKLTEPLPLSGYPLLPTAKTHDAGPTFRALGYGKTSSSAAKSEQFLREVDLPVIGDSKCGQYAAVEVCAGDLANGGIDTCQGDSGGPLLKQVGAGWVQVGVTSWGIGCARKGQAGHYTRVSAFTADIQTAIKAIGGQPATTVS
ncbi:serine protease [Pilimelia columellifera]|uniref:Serine protease n=1 Tax=Pilimelia columellifera subsp. columellifera TaxID=706583 RepID=A0ABP6ALX4_9ACTN